MVRDGLVDEVAGLLHAGYDERAPGMNATGYIELLAYLRGEVSLEEALDRVRRNTRAYARRQATWFRHQLPEGAIRLDARLPREDLVRSVVAAALEGQG
jgi:tRNA dimethylallyltransferase